MEFTLNSINWLGVAAATLVYSAFSGIWHRQFAFGKAWEAAMGFQRPDNWKESPIYFIVPLLGCFTASLAMAILIQLVQVDSMQETILLGLLVGIGVAMTVTFTNAVIPTMKKPLLFATITGTAHAIGMILVSVILLTLGTHP